jgi:hypothetical protein
MVHLLKKKRLGIRPVTGIVERQILPGTGFQGVISGHDALGYDRGGFRSVALPDEFFAGAKLADFATQATESGNVRGLDGLVVF